MDTLRRHNDVIPSSGVVVSFVGVEADFAFRDEERFVVHAVPVEDGLALSAEGKERGRREGKRRGERGRPTPLVLGPIFSTTDPMRLSVFLPSSRTRISIGPILMSSPDSDLTTVTSTIAAVVIIIVSEDERSWFKLMGFPL